MLGFLNLFVSEPKSSGKDVEYFTSIMNSALSKKYYDDKTRASVLHCAKKLRESIVYTKIPLEIKEQALGTMNKVKVHLLSKGTPKDYLLFAQLERLTKNL